MKFFKLKRRHVCLRENALFWVFLALLSIGCMAKLYEQASLAPASSESVFASSQAAGGRDYQVKDRKLPIYCVQTEKPQVALSFDAAWGNEDTRQLMEILAKHNVKVTFFMTGGWVEKYPEDVKYIASQGHDLGNHSENHKNMSQLSDTEIRDEIMSVHKKVKELTGYEMFLFRPPYGDYDNEVITGVLSCGYYPIQWSIDSLDWKDYGVDDIISRICDSKHLDGGAIILCHNGAKYTADALDNLLTQLQEKGYQLVPISELIYREKYHLDVTGKQIAE